MIKITDDFEVQSYEYGWELHRIVPGKKEGTTSRKIAFYSSWGALSHALLEQNMRLADNSLESVHERLVEMLTILETWNPYGTRKKEIAKADQKD